MVKISGSKIGREIYHERYVARRREACCCVGGADSKGERGYSATCSGGLYQGRCCHLALSHLEERGIVRTCPRGYTFARYESRNVRFSPPIRLGKIPVRPAIGDNQDN